LVDGVADDLVFPFEVVHAVLLVGEFPPAFSTLKSVFFSTLVFEVPVEVVVPVVGPLTMRAAVDPLGPP